MKKRIVAALLIVLLVMGLAAILQSGSSRDVPGFSYAEDFAAFKDDPVVLREGKWNTAPSPIRSEEEALRRAREACTVSYDAVQTVYDPSAEMWRVTFYSVGMLGGGQMVYLDAEGVIHMIVHGE